MAETRGTAIAYRNKNYQIGFACVICHGNQKLPDYNCGVTFPVCDDCLKDLGEIIMEKRNGDTI